MTVRSVALTPSAYQFKNLKTMARDPIPHKSRQLFRRVNVLCAIFFGGLAAWMFSRGHDWILATLFAGAALFALIDAIVGWRKSKDRSV